MRFGVVAARVAAPIFIASASGVLWGGWICMRWR